MTDASTPTVTQTEDRALPAIVYALYIVSVPSAFLTAIIGLIIAYVCRDRAGPINRSHYDFQIATFWKSIWWVIIAVVMFGVGVLLSIILIGVPIMMLALAIGGLIGVWLIVRCVLGLVHLFKDEPYPRPHAWLV